MKNMKKIISILLCISLALCLFGCGAGKENTDIAEESIADKFITFFKTKNDADASLIHCGDKNVLIDSGEKGDAKKILKQLEGNGIEKLDLVILSHFDKDHCGGLIKLIGEIEIAEIIYPEYIKDSDEVEKLFKKISEEQIEHKAITENDSIKLGDIVLSMDVAKQKEYEIKPSNNSSMVIMAQIDNAKILYTGDAQEERVQELIDSSTDYDADILKLMYHGREITNEERFVARVNPSHTVITGDKDDKKVRKNIEALAGVLGDYRYTSDGNIVYEIVNDNVVVK